MATPAYPVNNIGREILPFRIVNQSSHAGQLYVYLSGTTNPASPEHNWFSLVDFRGNIAPCLPTGGTDTSYSLPIIGSETTLMLPRLSAMRMYFSFDMPLHVVVGGNGIPSSPAGWIPNSDYLTMFDWIELTWEKNADDTTLGGNTTQVDMFGMPFSLHMSGYDPAGEAITVAGGFGKDGVRGQILADLKAAPAPWNQLVVSDPAGADLRALSPYHGMEMGLFPKDQLQEYIDKVWAHYRTNTLTATAEGMTFQGRVNASDVLVFTPTTPGPSISFPKPDSFTVYTSGPLPTVAGAKPGVLMASLQAAFMRSTLLTSTRLPECDTSLYYKTAPVNRYAQIMHRHGRGGGAYAFGFDDVCGGSSFLIVHNPVSAGVTLLGF